MYLKETGYTIVVWTSLAQVGSSGGLLTTR